MCGKQVHLQPYC